MINYKNKLQEFCQKRSLDLPVYQTVYDNGFRSSVMIKLIKSQNNIQDIQDTGNIQESGDIFNNKKAAEQSAASKMLNRISEILHQKTINYTIPDNENVYILIDMENIHIGNYFEQKKFSSNIHFIGFATENHPALSIPYPELLKIVTIKSDRKDATDLLIVWYTSSLIENNEVNKIMIVTKDHFGSGLVDIINTMEYGKGTKGICLKSLNEINF